MKSTLYLKSRGRIIFDTYFNNIFKTRIRIILTRGVTKIIEKMALKTEIK